MRKEDKYRRARSQEFSRLTSNIEFVEQRKEAELSREGHFREVFFNRLGKLPQYKNNFKAQTELALSQSGLPPIQNLATALVIENTDGTKPDQLDIWIEPYVEDWKHNNARRRLNVATQIAHREDQARSAYIAQDASGNTHLILEQNKRFIVTDKIAFIDLMKRYGIQTIIGEINYTLIGNEGFQITRDVYGRIIETDLIGEIRLAESRQKYYEMYEMNPFQIQEFERRLSEAEKHQVGVSYHQIASEITGLKIRES